MEGKMKILVYGAGVLGSLCAARLKEGGNDVSLLARGSRLDFLRQNGILLEHATRGEKKAIPIEVVEMLEPQDAYDLVIVLMGRHQVAAVLPVLQANHQTPNVMFMGNNVSGADEYQLALGKERVLLGFYMAAGTIKDGVVWYADDVKRRRRKIPMGETDGKMSQRVEQIAEAFKNSGLPVEVSQNIDAWLKTHAAMVVPISGALCMAGGNLGGLASNDAALRALANAWKELLQALTAAQVPILPASAKIYTWIPEGILVNVFRQALRNPAMAIGLSHADKARPEMRCLAGELINLARSAGVATPALKKLQAAI
jgi:2-dehydropantoate 2-reductase